MKKTLLLWVLHSGILLCFAQPGMAETSAHQAAVKPILSGEEAFAQAVRNADQLIADFEHAAASGNDASIRQAALKLQKDPIAVLRTNQNGTPFLKERLNLTLETIKHQTKNMARERIARHYGVKPEEVTFFEATNPSAAPKVGQDWDVTPRVRGMDVPVEVSKPIIHGSYYEAAQGAKPPTPGAASQFAAEQAVEVTDYRHREAYGGSRSEGSRIITGPKDQALRDPPQIAKAIADKSNEPRQKALDLERQGRHVEAQGQWVEQARQYDKQFERQIKPRVEAAGGKVPNQVIEGSAILKEVAQGRISPAEGRARLAQMGETPESIISKGADLVEAAQKLRSPGGKGSAAPDVLAENVRDQMELNRLERAARGKTALEAGGKPPADGAPEGRPTPGKGVAAEPPSQPGVSATRVAGTTAGALTLADLYLNYQACTTEGRSDTECMREFTFMAMGGAVITGVGGVTFETLAALGVSTATMGAITTGLAVAGLPLAVYGVYKGGERWAEAPAIAADNRLREQQKDLLPRFSELVQGVQGDLQLLRDLAAQSTGLCQQIVTGGGSAGELREATTALLSQLKALTASVAGAGSQCDAAGGMVAEITSLGSAIKQQEERVIKDLDTARNIAGQCTGKADADKIRKLYLASQDTAARVTVSSAIVRGRSNKLQQVKAQADSAGANIAAAEAILRSMGNHNARIHEVAATRTSNNDALKGINANLVSERAAIEARINHLAGLLPEHPPSPVFKEELMKSQIEISMLRQRLLEIPAPQECQESVPVLQWSLEMENLFAGASDLFTAARDSLRGCEEIVTADATAEETEASANWVLQAVAMNEHLPERAASCLATSGKGALVAAIGGPPQALIGSPVSLVGTVTLDGVSVTDSEGYAYRWETDDGKSVTGKKSVTLTPRTPGEKVIRLTITDSQGRSASAAATIKVPVRLQVNIAANKTVAIAGDKVTATATINDEAALCPCTFAWRATGIGQTFTGKSVWFGYNKPGQYPVTLDVKDRFGQTASAAHTIAVKAAADSAAPPAPAISQKDQTERESLQRERALAQAREKERLERERQAQARREEQARLEAQERARREEAHRYEEAERLRREQAAQRQANREDNDPFGDLRNRPESTGGNFGDRLINVIDQIGRAKEEHRQESERIEREWQEGRRQLEEQRQQEIAQREQQEREQQEAARLKCEKSRQSLREQLSDWQKGLDCLEEGKRKSPNYWLDCNGHWTMRDREVEIQNLRQLINKEQSRLDGLYCE